LGGTKKGKKTKAEKTKKQNEKRTTGETAQHP
jgi:hypothetical protein